MSNIEERFAQRIAALATITAPGPGVTRAGFSELEREAHRQVGEWATADGAVVGHDPVGNTVMTFRDGEPYFLLGSHLDSVPNGGRYDGVAGVLTALEAAQLIQGDITTGLRVVAFAAEEGATFGRPCLGSALATGELRPDELRDLTAATGRTAAEDAAAIGLEPQRIQPWLSPDAVAAFLELHIEQSLVLENEGVRVGVVDAVSGAARLNFECWGQAGHSGTTPMRLRADALTAAAEVVLGIEQAAREERDVVATVGRLVVKPNSVTTIPSNVEATIDVRAVDTSHQIRVVEKIEEIAQQVGSRRGMKVELTTLSWRDPVLLAAWPKRALKRACAQLTTPFRVMSSGAGHDAAVIAMRIPAAMLFVPTPGGMSHVPDEDCRLEDLAAAVEILACAIRHMDADVNAAIARGGGRTTTGLNARQKPDALVEPDTGR